MSASRLPTDSPTAGGTQLDAVVDHGVFGLVNTAGQTFTLLACWVGVGLAAAAVLGRRGHEFRPYAALGAVLGPMFLFLAYDAIRRRESEQPIRLSSASASTSPPVLVVAVGSIEDPASTVDAVQSLGDIRDVLAAVPTTYEVGDRVRHHGQSPPGSGDLEALASILGPLQPGLLMLPGPLEKSLPVAVDETGASAVVLVGGASTAVAPELEETLAARVVRIDGRKP